MKNLLVFALMFFSINNVVLAGSTKPLITESKVEFTIKNFGLSIHGSFTEPNSGTFVINEKDLSQFFIDTDIAVKTINTGNEKRDNHLRTADYFDVAKYPTIHFVTTSVTKYGSGYMAKGKLKIKDVEKEVIIPFTVTHKDGKTILASEGSLDRIDYHVGGKSIVMGNDVKFNIVLVLGE